MSHDKQKGHMNMGGILLRFGGTLFSTWNPKLKRNNGENMNNSQ